MLAAHKCSELNKGKPVVRQGRKVRGLAPRGEMARPPAWLSRPGFFACNQEVYPVKSMRKLILAATAVLALSAFATAGAQACNYTGAEQVFGPWGDQHSYVLGPDGGFEAGGQGWRLTGGATAVSGNESFFLNDASDSRALSLPAGSSATSPPVCMSLDTPIF